MCILSSIVHLYYCIRGNSNLTLSVELLSTRLNECRTSGTKKNIKKNIQVMFGYFGSIL